MSVLTSNTLEEYHMAIVHSSQSEIEFKKHPSSKRFTDLTGLRVDRLLVLGYAGFINNPSWYCKCDCGVIKIIQGQRLRSGKPH